MNGRVANAPAAYYPYAPSITHFKAAWASDAVRLFGRDARRFPTKAMSARDALTPCPSSREIFIPAFRICGAISRIRKVAIRAAGRVTLRLPFTVPV